MTLPLGHTRTWSISTAVLATAVLATALFASALISPNAAAEAPRASDPPTDISWQSAGDSFSSGEGVRGNRGDCAQSSGAYGPLAIELLSDRGWEISNSTFTACTGHLVEDVFNARGDSGGKESLWQWGRSQGGPDRADIVTLSFGGNDIGFPDVVFDCLAVTPDSWQDLMTPPVPVPRGCTIGESEIQKRIDNLLDPPRRDCMQNRRTDKAYDCALALEGRRGSIIDFYYDVVDRHLTDRGRLYVVGYPSVFASVGQWPKWSPSICAGVTRGDAQMLVRGAEYLDGKLSEAVNRANEAFGRERVVFVDRYSLFKDGGHELCGQGEDWINGLSTRRNLRGAIRYQGSFHPNGRGHSETAQLVADRVFDTFPGGALGEGRLPSPTWDEIKDAEIPSMCEHEPTTLVDGEDVTTPPELGGFTMVQVLENGSTGMVTDVPSDAGPLTAVIVNCSAGGVGWPDQVMFFGPGGTYVTHVALWEGDWEGSGLASAGRNGAEGIFVDGDEVDVYTTALLPDDIECCASSYAHVRIRVDGTEARVVSVEEADGG